MWDENYHEKEFSYLAAIEKGRKLPDWVAEEPYLEPGEEWILNAYHDLATGRGMDGSIPWRDMVLYAEHAGLEEDVAKGFVRIIRRVDNEKLKRVRDTKNGMRPDGVEVEGFDAQAAMNIDRHNRTEVAQTASKEQMMAAARNRAGRKREK